jgi:hypothetical protein
MSLKQHGSHTATKSMMKMNKTFGTLRSIPPKAMRMWNKEAHVLIST